MKYAYLFGSLLYLAAWLIIFIFRKDLRRKMFFISLYTLPLAPIAEIFHFRDYWYPLMISKFPIEDLIYSFSLGGTGTTIYQFVFRKEFSKERAKQNYWLLILVTASTVIWLWLSKVVFGLNSIYAVTSAFLAIGIIFVSIRKDLLRGAILGGVLFVAVAFIIYQVILIPYPNIFTAFWKLGNSWQPIILRIPAEELIWAFAWGFVATPAYELTFGLKLKQD